MRLSTDERRAHPRRELSRPCKVRLGSKYVAGHTRDVSSGGTLVRLDRRVAFRPGDVIDVGIAWDDATLIRADEMARGRVARVITNADESACVAIALERVLNVAHAA